MPVLEVDRVSKTFGSGELAVHALKESSFAVEAGELAALLGPSGSGKSTLLLSISLILEPSTGRIVMNGREVYNGGWTGIDVRRFRRENIGFIFQSHNLIPFLTTSENVALVMQLNGAGRRDAARRGARRSSSTTSRSGTARTRCRRTSRAASSSGWRSGGRSPTSRRSSSPTSRPPRSTPTAARGSWGCCARSRASAARR
jgi:ABC-type lipoprotein export system ATPase subunit